LKEGEKGKRRRKRETMLFLLGREERNGIPSQRKKMRRLPFPKRKERKERVFESLRYLEGGKEKNANKGKGGVNG